MKKLIRNRAILFFAVLLIYSPFAFCLQATNPVLTMDFSQVQKATSIYGAAANIDSPISTYISSNGNRYWQIPYNYNGGVYLATTQSSAANAYENLLGDTQWQSGQWNIFGNYSQFPGRWWIVATLQLNSNPVELLSFIHAECLDVVCTSAQPQRSGLGVAYFKQGENGNKYRYMGLILTPRGDPANFNVQGAPYLLVGGNIQVYYSDLSSATGASAVAVARTSLTDLVAAARSGQMSPGWKKYHQGTWAQPGLGGDFTGLNEGSSVGVPAHHIVHSGAAFSTYSKKYYLTTYVNSDQAPAFSGWPQGNGVFLFESEDSINWVYKRVLYWAGITAPAPHPPPAHTPGFEYISVTSTDPGAWSYGFVGGTFYVYACFDQGSGLSKMTVYRTLVTLEPNDCAGGPAACGAP